MSLLETTFNLHLADGKRHLRLPFECPRDVAALEIKLIFDPPGAGELRTMINFSLLDPNGFRGANHRHGSRHEVNLSASGATPGFLPGPISPGEWELVLHTHFVATHTTCALSVRAADAVPEDERSPTPSLPKWNARKWVMGDLHCHTNHSDARWTVHDLARAALARGLSFLALTDHNTVSGRTELERLAPDLLLLPGLELTTY